MVGLIGYCSRAVVAAVLVFSCAAEVPESYQDPATERMAKRLVEIEQNLNPATNTYINAARVEYLQMLELLWSCLHCVCAATQVMEL